MPQTHLDLESALEIGVAFASLGSSVQSQLQELIERGDMADLNINAVAMIETKFLPHLPAEADDALREAIAEWREVHA